MQRKYQDRGFKVLAVDVWDDDAATLRRYARQCEINYAILLNGSGVGSKWGVEFIPDNFLLDKKGNIVERIGDLSPEKLPHVESKIERLLR